MPERKKNKRASGGKNCGSSAPSLDLTLLIAAHLGWQRPDLEIGRARFLAVTARVNWCRPQEGRARIAGGAADKVARMPGKRFDELRQCRKGKRTKELLEEKTAA